MEAVLGFSTIGSSVIVRFTGSAGTDIVGATSQHIGIAFKADSNIVDMLCGSYANGKIHMCRITKQSVGNYTVTRKSVSLS